KGDRVLRLVLPRGDGDTMIQVVAIDSSKPDLAEGEVGRERYNWIRQQFAEPADLNVFVLHHHLVPVPGTGRERNTVWDAGDVLALLIDAGVDLVLSGHKHVPHVWLLDHVFIVNSGGLLEGAAASRWESFEAMEEAMASRDVAEGLVRILKLLRQEPVTRIYEVLV